MKIYRRYYYWKQWIWDQNKIRIGYYGKISEKTATWREIYWTKWKCINETTKTGNSEICGNAKKWPELWDSYKAAIGKPNLLDAEKFNYLKTLLIGEVANAISGLSLTNDNYGEAINILKNRFGNKQIIILSHMNSFLKLPLVKENDLQQFRSFYDEVDLNVRVVVTLGVAVESFGTLVLTDIIDKLSPVIKLLTARHIKDTWNLTKILELLNEKLEDCLSPNHMLFGRSLKLFYPDQGGNEIILSKKLHNIIYHFWDRWRKEYLVNLREC